METQDEKALTVNESVDSPFKTTLKVVVDEHATPSAVLKQFDKVCEGLAKNQLTNTQLLYIVGLLGLRVKRQRLYSPEFTRFGDYMKEHVEKKYGLARATWNRPMFVLRYTPISFDEFQSSSMVNLVTTAKMIKAARKSRPLPSRQVKAMISSAGLKAPEFEKRFVTASEVPRHSGFKVFRVVDAPPSLLKTWNKIVGDRKPIVVLQQAIHLLQAAAKENRV